MGYYINPPFLSKEEFLRHHGYPITAIEAMQFWKNETLKPDYLPVCAVDNNGEFTALGIAYSPEETMAFIGGENDTRTKRWFLVRRTDLKPYYPRPGGKE